MSQFFTIVSDGAGNPMYFNEEQRKQIINKNLFDKNGNRISDTDSHSSIMAYNGIFGNEEDWYNKYEYNPFTKILTKDAINNKDDSDMVKKFCDNLDFKTIVPELIIENIVNPKDIVHGDKVSEHEIELLHMWTSVEGSVEGSVGHSVRDSVRDSVFNSVWDSVFNSVWNSVWDSVIVYISSFFMIENCVITSYSIHYTKLYD